MPKFEYGVVNIAILYINLMFGWVLWSLINMMGWL